MITDNFIEHWAEENNLSFLYPTYTLIGITILVLVFLIAICIKPSKKRAVKGSLYLITGITNAGKTALYARVGKKNNKLKKNNKINGNKA